MIKITVTDIDHIPEGPARDLMIYLQDSAEEIQAMEPEMFWATIMSYICVYYEASDGEPLDLAIRELVLLLITGIEHTKRLLEKEVNDE